MKEKRRILSAVIWALLCASVISLATYAWLAKNRATESPNIGMDIEAEGVTIVDGDVYRYNMEYLRVDRLSLNQETRLNEYDSIFLEAESNKKASVFFVIHLEQIKQADFDVIVSCDNPDWSATAMNSSDILKVNCVSAKAIYGSWLVPGSVPQSYLNENPGATLPDYLFSSLNAYFSTDASALATQDCFAKYSTYTNLNGVRSMDKDSELVFRISLTGFPIDDITQRADIVLMFDYDRDLVSAQDTDDVFGSGQMISLGEPIDFSTDIQKIRFDYTTS